MQVKFTLNYAKNKGDFKYDVNLNLTFIKNEITSLAGGDPIRGGSAGRVGNTTKTEVGREIAYFYGYKTSGIFKTQEQLDAHKKDGTPIQPNAALGDVIFQDLNDDGKITELDMTYLGSASPKMTGGLNVNLAYKGFDMVIFINGSFGNEIVNSMYQTLYSSKMFECNISRDMALNHWSPENPNSDIPRLDAADLNKNAENFSDRYVENGSYLRLKNLQFGYSLPAEVNKVLHIQNLRIYTSLDNLATLTKYTGLDPELFGQGNDPFSYGVDMVNYPQPRTYSFGINVTF
jgi:TonB-dependent starch-binding outer membrane protein SusC